MSATNFDVVIVGAGCAGATAAIGLARAGFSVGVVEAAAFPGAENWSGCVYFGENLADPDVLGPEALEALPWERRLVERGFFGTDGYSLLGARYRDPAAFRHCYTVLRPIYDRHVAKVAAELGAVFLNETTAESLIREGDRVVGVCTHRGPLYADLVFLAEGDASNLVTREGYERYGDERDAPKFLHGIKQVIEMPEGAIEEIFRVGPEEGVAYEMLLRNGRLRGKPVNLNMGGFVYTNRQSLSVGLVLPADNLHHDFGGDPNLLIEWFEGLPALQPWLKDGKRGVFGAKLIRGGGARDIPTLVDHGLAIGGAASAIGIDFPYPNFTGPATAMGLLFARAASQIRAAGGDYSREALTRHYLEPLRRSHYWQDVEFLRRWPGYVKRTKTFFGANLDLALGTAYVWSRPDRGFTTKWLNWVRLLKDVGVPNGSALRTDARHFARALRISEIASLPSFGRLMLDGTVNALRDLFRRPRANVPAAGTLHIQYAVAGGTVPVADPPAPIARWFRRMVPVLAAAARRVYSNEPVALADKLPETTGLLARQVNILDIVTAGAAGLAAVVSGGLTALGRRAFFRRGPALPRPGSAAEYALAAEPATDLTPVTGPAAQQWEARLARLAYDTVKTSHIRVLWPQSLGTKNDVVNAGLWHVCPAHVYEVRTNPMGQPQVVVNFENCIKCETCWRTSDAVDWGRDGRHRFTYPVQTPAANGASTAVPAAPVARSGRAVDRWAARFQSRSTVPVTGGPTELPAKLLNLADRIEQKLVEFDEALGEQPRTVDRARADHLEMLARYAQQLAELLAAETLRLSDPSLRELGAALFTKTQERTRRTWNQQYSWAAADGRQLRWHHLAGIRAGAQAAGGSATSKTRAAEHLPWSGTEAVAHQTEESRAEVVRRLDVAFSPMAWRDLERQTPLTHEQDQALLALAARVPVPDAKAPAEGLASPFRKALLAELGRRDPSLAYRVASHLWARDLLVWAGQRTEPRSNGEPGASGWLCLAVFNATQAEAAEAWCVPATGAGRIVVLNNDRVADLAADSPALSVEPLAALGLRGAGLARVRLTDAGSLAGEPPVNATEARRVADVLASADLISIAFGMADQLCGRAVAHATGRVQFPGLFQDIEARDTIGKFGAVKRMVAEIAARRYLIETADHALAPVDYSEASATRAALVKAVVAEALGTSPGSVSYNAGQVFGGTGYSEDDILSKYYRDAAAWRYLGPDSATALAGHGLGLLAHWLPDGLGLSGVADEAALFDEIAQRQALVAELDEIRNGRSKIRALVADWLRSRPAAPSDSDAGNVRDAEVAEGLARQDVHLLAGKALLLRTHARLEAGVQSEAEIALVRVWLDDAAASLEEFEATVRRHLDPSVHRDELPAAEISTEPPAATYAAYMAAPAPYDSGDFLRRPVDLNMPRYVPELAVVDPALADRDREYQKLMLDHFGPVREGLPYERYVERRHRPDEEDLDFCRSHGFFRMPVARELGGEGRLKAEYYLLTMNAQRLADVSISLSIQANTSIGTTPVLLARDKDLPKARKEVAGLLGDEALRKEIATALRGLAIATDPAAVGRLHERLDNAVLSRAALKGVTRPFGSAWQKVRKAQAGTPAFREAAERASAAWEQAVADAAAFDRELTLRQQACDLFLRWVSSGHISAFALTEPSAGSDTARVATRTVLRSVPVEPAGDGVFHFVPAGGERPRVLLDASRLVFDDNRPAYRVADGAPPAPVRFDEYDYETDDPARLRYLDVGGRRVPFSDIAFLRPRDGRLWYDYWELTGAKMWITNGRMCGIMALYAKTEDGVTGFIVDRHAEGLVVGKDEAKMGQNGSPTNELSLQAVRVPRENVLGLEGRGQVNALETLNVGRAGLATSAVAQMPGLIESSRAFAERSWGVVPPWVAWRLDRMRAAFFTAESLAFEVVGRFDHAQAKSVRMESAISKMLASELLHEIIELAEDVHGLAGQTERHLVEKRKRDARILNIYEGTNEIQRFLILKEIASELGPAWASAPAQPPKHAAREAVDFEASREALRRRARAALEAFGQNLWQDPDLQASCFVLAEAAAWLKAAESVLGRLAWLARRELGDEAAGPQISVDSAKITAGRGALARCLAEVRTRLLRFDEELAHLRRGFYAPAVRAASLLFGATAEGGAEAPALRSDVTRPLSVLVVAEPVTPSDPNPRVLDGRLLDPKLGLGPPGRSALEAALRLRDEAAAPVRVQVVATGPRAATDCLREALSLGADRARLVATDCQWVAPAAAARAIAATLNGERFDLVLGGAGAGDDEEGALPLLTAAALGLPYAGTAAAFVVFAGNSETVICLADPEGRPGPTRLLPAGLTVNAGPALRPFTTLGYVRALAKDVEIVPWPVHVPAPSAVFATTAPAPESHAEVSRTPRLSPLDAAGVVRDEVGVGATGVQRPYEGRVEPVEEPNSLGRHGVVAVLAADAEGRLAPTAAAVLATARDVGNGLGISAGVLLFAPADPARLKLAVGAVLERLPVDVVALTASDRDQAVPVRQRLLALAWPRLGIQPTIVLGEPWAEPAFSELASADAASTVLPRVRSVMTRGDALGVESARAGGRLAVSYAIPLRRGTRVWVILAAQAEARQGEPGRGNVEGVRVQTWTPALEGFYTRADVRRLLDELKAGAGLTRLADAEVIVDVGFGVGNRDGYEAVIEPLVRALEDAGVHRLMVGGSRKVTEELHLLPVDRQIGQSGVSVNPKLLIAVGVSGAPQHLAYIGSRAAIVAFNRDPEAPIMVLARSRPRVYPVVGDLFATVPAFVAALRQEQPRRSDSGRPVPAAVAASS